MRRNNSMNIHRCIARCSTPRRYLTNIWWRMTGSNRRPPACKAGALPAELILHSDFDKLRISSSLSFLRYSRIKDTLRFLQNFTSSNFLLLKIFFNSFGDPYGIRTRVTAVKGRCLNRLTNGPCISIFKSSGGERGIRTLETVYHRLHDFQSCSFGQLGQLSNLAPQAGLEPATDRLTADCSTN